MSLDEKFKEIKTRCEAASNKYELVSDDFIRLHKLSPYTGKVQPANGFSIGSNDANFIAHARTDVPMQNEMLFKTIKLVEKHGCFCQDADDLDVHKPYKCFGCEWQEELEKIAGEI